MSNSTVIYQGPHYTASVHPNVADGPLLVVSRNKRRKCGDGGRCLEGFDAELWAGAIKTAIDGDEAAALCRAIVNS